MSADLETLLSRAEALDKNATPGPWRFSDAQLNGEVWAEYEPVANTLYWPADDTRDPDGNADERNAAFIAEARTLLPQMARMLRKVQALCDSWELATGMVLIAACRDLRSALTPDADGDDGG